ncbi:signal transduction histidine kinase [Rhizobium sp. SG_E_25_P2]|uniref:sensor histidine kinase n=1 Tax=Rhizobium sp. SG_E_25_P2 TaxID=2879942 RepID=UPI0024742910|nr:ATP-binding protein [Rhizobium sp. SG_E_25_P2]MDH6266407.1 signal transduction histidine kinase [Rhizobium sp. SG_E_25_P2]
MSDQQQSLIRSTFVALIVSAFLLAGIVAGIIYLVYKTQDYVAGAAEARRVRSAAADLLLSLQDSESGQRGFLLTMEPTFLKPYRDSIDEIGRRENVLEAAIAGSRFSEIEIEPLRRVIAQKLNELKTTLSLAQSERREQALAMVRNQVGLTLMNDIRSTLSEMIAEADRQIAGQLKSHLSLAAGLRMVTIAGAIAVLAVFIIVFLIIRRYVQEILVARRELEGLNAGLEQRVRERTEDLIQANQEIQRFAYIVTHDLRAPLVNIMGFTSELDNALKTIQSYFKSETGSVGNETSRVETVLAVEEDLPEAIGFIRSSTRKMDELINAILKISRDGRRQLKPERIDLAALIQHNVAAIQHQVLEARGEADIKVDVKSVVTDRFSLEQALGNLLDNAVKYREPERPLRLSVRAFRVNAFTIGIDVSDNGRGIAPEDHERVFELFRRSGVQDRPGEGIGLAHVRSLVRNMGGDIQLKSERGTGSTFMIRMPSDLSRFVGSISE